MVFILRVIFVKKSYFETKRKEKATKMRKRKFGKMTYNAYLCCWNCSTFHP